MLPGSVPRWRRSEQIQSNRASRRNRHCVFAAAVGAAHSLEFAQLELLKLTGTASRCNRRRPQQTV